MEESMILISKSEYARYVREMSEYRIVRSILKNYAERGDGIWFNADTAEILMTIIDGEWDMSLSRQRGNNIMEVAK